MKLLSAHRWMLGRLVWAFAAAVLLVWLCASAEPASAAAAHSNASHPLLASHFRPTSASFSFAPFSTAMPPFTPVVHPLPVTAHWSAALLQQLGSALPTNQWWQNLVLTPSNQPVTVSPLSLRVETVDTSRVSAAQAGTAQRQLSIWHCRT